MDKAVLAIAASAACLGAGLALPGGPVHSALLSAGLFALSGGLTNALAVKMLFDRIPGCIGSGVIPARHGEIREKIRELVLSRLFDPASLQTFFRAHREEFRLEKYLRQGPASAGTTEAFVEAQWDRLASPETIQPLVDREIERLMDSPVGGFLIVVGMDNVKPPVRQFVGSLMASLKDRVRELARSWEGGPTVQIDADRLIEDIRGQVQTLLEAKLAQLDRPAVKRLLEEVLRGHLDWLVVWGAAVGAVFGLGAFALGLWTQLFWR